MMTFTQALRWKVLILGAALAATLTTFTGARADGADVVRTESQVIVGGGACVEPVLLDIDTQVVSRFAQDGSGAFHFERVINVRAVGVGLVSGETYRAHSTELDLFRDDGVGPTGGQLTSTLHQMLIGPGGAVFRVSLQAHLTETPDGNLAVSFLHDRTECLA